LAIAVLSSLALVSFANALAVLGYDNIFLRGKH
jgi:hypothetical protein